MSYWNYRIIRKYHKGTDTNSFHIHEVYYNDKHQIDGWTKSAIAPMGETLAELKRDIELLTKAFEKSVLVERIENGKEILAEDTENSSS